VGDFLWFVTADVRALSGDAQPLVEGSSALVHCVVRAPGFESALPELREFLRKELFQLVDVFSLRRFRPEDADDPDEPEHVTRGLREARRTGLPWRGLMITADESSQWKQPSEREESRGRSN
jgi:hypothetical protein